VALTLQALTPVTDGVTTPTSVPEETGLLPNTLYFINNDGAGVPQVFRMERDGETIHPVTAEPGGVGNYDVSPTDGSVAYVANNQLLLINADGSGRRTLADGGAIDPNNPFATSLSSPVFSPDGQTIAYSYRGLVLYNLSAGTSNTVLQEIGPDPITGTDMPLRMFFPQSYSPDGTKLLITIAIPNSDGFSANLYTIANGALTPLSGDDGARLCCGQQAWTADGSMLYEGSATVGMFSSGLWRVDANTGNTTTLIPGDAGGGAYNLIAYPYPAPDGNLYFFYNTALNPDGMIDRAPLQIVRTAVDGVTGRSILRPENFSLLNEALWAPDASFVLTATAPVQDVREGGILELYYTDGRPVIQLLDFASGLKWGP
jgi:Tol biopolymer transport system component